jgi:glutamate-1-semialdehyde 2,1-aminomutase
MDLTGQGAVLHGGTYNANVVSVVAALAALAELSTDDGRHYAEMEARGERLMAGLRGLGEQLGVSFLVQGLGTVFNTAFTDQEAVTDYRSYQRCDLARQRRFLLELQHRGARPTSRGTWFLSTTHTDADVDETLQVAHGALEAVR